MKLAEALIRRKASQQNVEQLRLRLVKVAKVQEGDPPAEQPQELLATLEADLQELQTLIVLINRTNLGATLADGTTLMEAIAQRDILKLRRGTLEALLWGTVEDTLRHLAEAEGEGATRQRVQRIEAALIQRIGGDPRQRLHNWGLRSIDRNYLEELARPSQISP